MAAAGFAYATDTTLGVGVDYSRGDYGSDIDTEILSVPVTARVQNGNWRLSASVPWLRVSGDPNVLPAVGAVPNLNPLGRGRDGLLDPTPDADAEAERGSASGIGDVTVVAAYSVPTDSAIGIDLGVKAKLATADEDKGLGTGANDYGVSVDLYRDFDGTVVFGGVAHTWLGSSTFIDVDSIQGGNLGLSRQAGRGKLGMMYEHRTAAASGLGDRREAVGFYSLPTTSGGRLQVYASHGLSDGGPDWGAGIAVSAGF
ncbi:transporter [Novilysobacter erysipheiresistens]|uniref:Transporter n=1 Tax=Novilysobacter erysipheiresistens TaxID=1749332 RepID=A0ABU7YWW8_9GAMM